MSSTFGNIIKLSVFGQSHGPAIGMTLDGVPAGLPVDLDKLHAFLDRRAPGRAAYATTRKEADKPEILAGIVNGYTCGAPIAATIFNHNTRSGDYENLKDQPRPGHADYPAQVKYGGYQDVAGGGHFSGRLTAPVCIAGGLCKQWLEQVGICVAAHIHSIAGIIDGPDVLSRTAPDLSKIRTDFPVVNFDAGEKMCDAIEAARMDHDSVGGVVECFVTGLPAGIGDPMFDGIENRIAQIVYGIPAVKGLEFGSGFSSCDLRGSENNDAYITDGKTVKTSTNNAGGILGGITTGMPVIFRVAIKPTPSIGKAQDSVRLSQLAPCQLEISGRHDPCIVPRAVPVVEAAAAIAIYDAYLSYLSQKG